MFSKKEYEDIKQELDEIKKMLNYLIEKTETDTQFTNPPTMGRK